MFPTPKQRYDRYWTWCLIVGAKPASFDEWKKQSEKIPEHLPIAWGTSGIAQGAFLP
jgi:hypothetical protein